MDDRLTHRRVSSSSRTPRQGEAEDRPRPRVRLDPDPAAVGLDDGARDREADPIPCALVVMKGWKSWSATSGLMPWPVSLTQTSTMSSAAGRGADDQLAARRVLHRLDGVADQVQRHLLDLHLVGQHQVDAAGRSRSAARTPRSLAPTMARAPASSSSLGRLSMRRSASPLETKSRSRRMIWPARRAWSRGLARSCPRAARSSSRLALQQHAGSPSCSWRSPVSGWLSSCARAEAISPSAVRRETWTSSPCTSCSRRSVGLALGEVADEAGEVAPLAGAHLAHGQLHREGRAVLALAHHHPADADDPPLAGRQVARRDSRRGRRGRGRASAC